MRNVLNRPITTDMLRFLIVTSFTGLNLVLGLLSLFVAVAGYMELAAIVLIVCTILDACDGALARYWGVTSEFGEQLDSLADMTAFTIGSAVLAFYWLEPKIPFAMLAGASCLYVLSGAIRLARFNVSVPSSQYFQGLPTTFVAAIVATTYLAHPQLNSGWGFGLVVLLAVLMVSMFPYPKLCHTRKFPLWLWGIIAGGLLINWSWMLWLMALIYLLTGPAIWLYRLYKARQS